MTGNLQRPLAQLSQTVKIRETSEQKAKAVWKDVVYRDLEDRLLLVLSVEEKALKVALERADSAIDAALRRL
jgi:hypothetical protein